MMGIVYKYFLRTFIIGIIFSTVMMPLVFADVYINVMTVNGATERKETP